MKQTNKIYIGTERNFRAESNYEKCAMRKALPTSPLTQNYNNMAKYGTVSKRLADNATRAENSRLALLRYSQEDLEGHAYKEIGTPRAQAKRAVNSFKRASSLNPEMKSLVRNILDVNPRITLERAIEMAKMTGGTETMAHTDDNKTTGIKTGDRVEITLEGVVYQGTVTLAQNEFFETEVKLDRGTTHLKPQFGVRKMLQCELCDNWDTSTVRFGGIVFDTYACENCMDDLEENDERLWDNESEEIL